MTLNLAGARFGSLVVDRVVGSNRQGRIWRCMCDCGEASEVAAAWLRSGNTSSCGCGQRKAAAELCLSKTTHGETGSRLFNIWSSMKARTTNPNNIGWDYYGGRGVRVCEEWSASFVAFRDWALGAGYDDRLTIDRIDNDLGYSPANCRWASYSEQRRNQRRCAA